MKKHDLKTLAMIGLASGMMVGCQGWFNNGNGKDNGNGNSNGNGDKNGTNGAAKTAEPMAAMTMTTEEKAFADTLNAKAKAMFDKMNAEERTMAMDRAKQSCKGQNECKGLGGCKVDGNTAVELVDKAMKDKRSNMTK